MAAAATVRFAELVKRGGKPEVHLSWLAPAKDPELQRAQKQHRLVTVHQHARGPRDFGVVDFEPSPDAQFLVFQKSLRAFAGRRVVGIKYEMLTDADSGEEKSKPASRTREPPKTKAPAKSSKKPASRPKRSAPKKPTPGTEPDAEPEADFITDTDPLKREIRKALIALSGGRTVEAKRRLQAILADREED